MQRFVLFTIISLFVWTNASGETPEIPKFVLGPPPLDDGRAIRELAANPEQWKHTRSRIGNLLYADHVLNRQFKNDEELTELLGKFRGMNLPFQLEVGAVKPWGRTGQDCFEKQKPMWERFLRCGARIDGIAMDEPLNCCDTHLKMDNALEYAAEETATFIALVRKHYPDWTVGDIEGFPALTADQLIRWVDVLEKKLREKDTRNIDFFRIDVDGMHFVQNTGLGSWHDLKRIENHCRSKKIPVSIVYWAANYPAMQRKGLADDVTWYVGTMQMAFDYAAVGGSPDQIVVQSWVEGPKRFLPENEPFTFLHSARDISARFFPERRFSIDKPLLFDTEEADTIVAQLQVFPPDDPWNTKIEDWPVHPNSENMLKSIGLDKPLRTNRDMNFVLVPPHQPRIPVKILVYPDESDHSPFPVPDNTPIEGWPAHFTEGSQKKFTQAEFEKLFVDYQANVEKTDADRHAIVIDPVNMMEYDFWQMVKTPDGWACSCAAVFNLRKGHDRPMGWTSSDAAGLPLFPAVPRYDEFKNGEIKHALRFTVRNSRKAYVAPATHHAGRSHDENLPRMGERLRLKKDFDISGFSRDAKILLTALKKYGMIAADNGIEMAISVSPDERIPAMHSEIRRVKTSDFEIVEAPATKP